MKYLIVNGDDFGASRGINRGIIAAHRKGILTSTSVMVDMPASSEARTLFQECPEVSVGLHIALTRESSEPILSFDHADACRVQLRRQFQRFIELTGWAPTHLDSHHNIHRDPRLTDLFLELAQEHNLPLREHSPARYFSNFYGQWDGQIHLEQIGVPKLREMLDAEVRQGITELSCHPGYVDADLESPYHVERQTELRTLCDPAVREFLRERQIRLISFRELKSCQPS